MVKVFGWGRQAGTRRSWRTTDAGDRLKVYCGGAAALRLNGEFMRVDPLPTVFGYLDYRKYLRDWFDAKKAHNPRYSHRAFSRRTGQRSPSFLSDIISERRNLTEEAIPRVCTALGLEGEDADFFHALVLLDQAGSAREKNEAWARLAATRHFREARRLEGEGFRYLSHWYIPAVRELSALPGFQADAASVARSLCPNITVTEAEEALDCLKDLGMLVPAEGGGWEPREVRVVTPHEVARLAVQNYHEGMLGLARDAIERFPAEERHFLAVTANIPHSLIPKLKAELNGMYDRLLELVDGAVDPADEVVQIHLHFFPLSMLDQPGAPGLRAKETGR